MTRTSLALSVLLLAVLGCRLPVRIDHELTLVKNGAPLRGTVVIATIVGRDSPWWEDPTITGDWSTEQSELMKVQDQVARTDDQGRLHVKGKGVALNLLVLDGLSAYSVPMDVGLTTRLPTTVEVGEKGFVFPIRRFSFQEDTLADDPLIRQFVDDFDKKHDTLWIKVVDEKGEGLYNIPFEVTVAATGETVMRYVSGSVGNAPLEVPPATTYDVALYPEARPWPGRPEDPKTSGPGARQPPRYQDATVKGLVPVHHPEEPLCQVVLRREPG